MHVAYLITRLDEKGGAQIHVRDLACTLQSRGEQVTVISGTDGPTADFIRQQGIPVFILPQIKRRISPRDDWQAVFALKKLLTSLKPDVLSCHSTKAGILGRISGALARCPTLFTAHGYVFTGGVPALHRLFYWLIELAVRPITKRVICVSESDRRLALRARVARPDRVSTVYNGMPDLPVAPNRKPKNNEACRIIMVARFCSQKDHALLIRALSNLTDPPWHLTFVGGGDSSNIATLISKLGLSSRIDILGERHDVDALLLQSDIFVLASNWEGLPRSIIEAMRSSIPVIASNVGGVSELVEQGVSGFLVPRGDAPSLTKALQQLIGNRALCEQMGNAGRLRFSNHFTFNAMLAKTVGIYQTLRK